VWVAKQMEDALKTKTISVNSITISHLYWGLYRLDFDLITQSVDKTMVLKWP
jgi:hypothetical protein